MSEISLILVLHLKTNKTLNDTAKIQIKSKKHTPFWDFFQLWSNLMPNKKGVMCVYKSIFLLKKTVSFRKVWFSIPVFVGKVYFLFGYSVGKVYICTIKIIRKV